MHPVSPRPALRRLTATVAVVVAALAASTAAAPAYAAPTELEFSANGIAWSTTPLASVFPADMALIPGGTESQLIYLRNARSAPTSVVVVISDITVDSTELGDGLTLAASDFGSGGFGARPISSIEKCAEVAPRRDLAPGEVLAVRLDVALADWLSDGQGQASRADFRLIVGMGDREAPVTPDGCPTVASIIPAFPDTSGSQIASTGVTPPYAALSFAGFALGVGWILIVAARRRRREKTE